MIWQVVLLVLKMMTVAAAGKMQVVAVDRMLVLKAVSVLVVMHL